MPPRRVVLVVEDDPAVRRMLVVGLRGFLVDLDAEASDADAALRWVAGVRRAVVVTDVLMPASSTAPG